MTDLQHGNYQPGSTPGITEKKKMEYPIIEALEIALALANEKLDEALELRDDPQEVKDLQDKINVITSAIDWSERKANSDAVQALYK